MRIVFATGDAPWPSTAGGRLRDLATWTALEPLGDVRLVAFPFAVEPDIARLPAASLVHPVPWPRGRRARLATRLRATLRRRHVFQEHLLHGGAGRVLDAQLRAARPDVTVLAYPLFGEFVRIARRHSPRLVVDLGELRGQDVPRRLRTRSWAQLVRAVTDGLVLDHVEAAAAAADEVWFTRADDARRFGIRTGAATRVVPNTIDVARYAAYRPAPSSDPRFAFIGAFDNGQNVLAADWAIRAVLPEVRRRYPNARLTIIGRRPPARLRRLAEASGVDVRSDPDDAIAVLAGAGPLIVPLRTGTGTKLKILEAAAAGIPVVTTRRGLDGLDYREGAEVVVAETGREFADALDRLWSDLPFATMLAEAAMRRTAECYDWTVAGAAIRASVLPTGAAAA